MNITRTVEKIAEFVVGCDNQAVSPEVRDTIGKHLLDSIGCAIGAIGAKTTLHIKSVVDSFGGKPTCTLIGGGQSSPDRAALYNGCLVRYLDFMDSYLRPDEVSHPCDNIMAVLAAAEDLGASGQDFVTAVCISFEIQNHLLDLPTMRAGVNYTTPLAFSVAAGVSKVLGLDAQHTATFVPSTRLTPKPSSTSMRRWRRVPTMSLQVAPTVRRRNAGLRSRQITT